MSRVLSTKTVELLDTLPPYYRSDPLTQAIMQGVGARVVELLEMADTIRQRFVLPHLAAEDQYGSLAYWERTMRLPVRPAGVTEARRRDVVLAHWRKRRARTGLGWIEILTLLLGTSSWEHAEGPVPGHITITINDFDTSYAANEIARLARAITPAGLVINFVYAEGFIIGYSSIGTGPLG